MLNEISKYVTLFFLYGFLGWCAEVAFAACKHGRFVNRGFLNGPICPIYGFGVMMVVVLLRRFESSLVLLYFGSFVLTSVLELLTGFVLEKIFHTRWWDYSKMPLNIGGYVCLLFSFMWGAACVVIVRCVHPAFYHMTDLMPKILRWIMNGVLIAMMAVDIAATLAAIKKLSEHVRLLNELAGDIHHFSDELGNGIADHTIDAKAKMEQGKAELKQAEADARAKAESRKESVLAEVSEKRQEMEARSEQYRERAAELRRRADELFAANYRSHKRLIEAFPGMKSTRYAGGLEDLKARFEKLRSEKKGAKNEKDKN